MNKFNIGDEVQLTDYSGDKRKGFIVETPPGRDEYEFLLVQFPGWTGGHDGHGVRPGQKRNDMWYYPVEMLELVPGVEENE